jgi:AraC family transcriptional regulator, regulatory protein of adaptative response / methylated-DNA-[protein]-cysteine methyltransferase
MSTSFTLSLDAVHTAGPRGPATELPYALGHSWLGRFLVAAGDRGIRAGDDSTELVADLKRRDPVATLVLAEAALAPLCARVERLLDAPGEPGDLPLDLRGDGLQQKVWQALRAIPAGATESYAAVARRVGPPVTAKDVADACAANPIAVAIPCHRVVRSDGSISGYRWGVRRKRALLAREARR